MNEDKKIIIVSDIDGVVCDFYYGATQLSSALYGQPTKPIKSANADLWHITDDPDIDKKVWEVIKFHDSFWSNLPETEPGITKKFADLVTDKSALYFCTTRPDSHDEASPNIAARWLNKHGVELPNVVVTKKKGQFCDCVNADFFIDDKWKNIKNVLTHSEKTACFFLVHPYSERYVEEAEQHKQVKIIHDPSEFIRAVKKNER